MGRVLGRGVGGGGRLVERRWRVPIETNGSVSIVCFFVVGFVAVVVVAAAAAAAAVLVLFVVVVVVLLCFVLLCCFFGGRGEGSLLFDTPATCDPVTGMEGEGGGGLELGKGCGGGLTVGMDTVLWEARKTLTNPHNIQSTCIHILISSIYKREAKSVDCSSILIQTCCQQQKVTTV